MFITLVFPPDTSFGFVIVTVNGLCCLNLQHASVDVLRYLNLQYVDLSGPWQDSDKHSSGPRPTYKFWAENETLLPKYDNFLFGKFAVKFICALCMNHPSYKRSSVLFGLVSQCLLSWLSGNICRRSGEKTVSVQIQSMTSCGAEHLIYNLRYRLFSASVLFYSYLWPLLHMKRAHKENVR